MGLSRFQVPGVDRFFSNWFFLNLEPDHIFLRHGEFLPECVCGMFPSNTNHQDGSHRVTIAPNWTRGFRRLWASPVRVELWVFLPGLPDWDEALQGPEPVPPTPVS